MEDLKYKFLGLINKQGPKIPSMGFSDEVYHTQSNTILSVNSKTVSDADRPADQDILESIQAAYFSTNETFDICRFELDKLPDTLDCNEIEQTFNDLKRQHQVVSKQVLQLILQKQALCNEEFEKILKVNDTLSDTLEICRQSRMDLKIAKEQFANSLGVLANYRKRKLVQNLLNSLLTIKTLHCTEDRLQELLQEENYGAAIMLLQECQSAAVTFKHFSCIAALNTKLQETLEFTEEQLDQVLAKMCYSFDRATYSKLQSAYKLLKKTEIAMDHLHMHYTSAVYNTALSIVQSHVSSVESLDPVDSGKRPYNKLCMSISQDMFIPCLIDLCKALFKIILSYHQLMKWHNRDESADGRNLEENFDRNYIKQKLDNGLTKLWHDVQSKISTLLLNSDLASYKFDQFVQVLSIVHRLMEVGEEFCGSKSEELQESIRKQSVNYFKNYHAHRLEELKIFLENESWEACPVKHTFEILQLQEFKALRSVLRNFKTGKYPSLQQQQQQDNSNVSSNHSQDGSSVMGNFLIRYSEHGTPFDSGLDETLIDEDILADGNVSYSDESDEEAEELKKDYVDENVDEVQRSNSIHRKERHHSNKTPILTNTTLTVLRQMGKYLQMSRLLRTIAYDIIICMNQLFDYYLYAVHSFFAADLTISSNSLYTVKLNATLKRIADNLIADDYVPNETEQSGGAGGAAELTKIPKPYLSPVVDLKKPEGLHGLAERVVAVESVVFLGKQYEYLQGFLEYLMPQQSKIIIQQFFNQTISCATDLRRPVYMTVAAQSFNLRQILMSMSRVNWEVKDVMSQHSSYIDILLREIQIFAMRLEDVPQRVHLSSDVQKLLWENIAHIVTHTLVQGFSDAKKCSNGGRALMQLDFTQFLSKFEKLSALRPVPHREYVENYVKAYYLPETELERWIREHTEYSSKHLLGLVSCACQNNKKTRQKLISVIEEMERISPR